MELTSSPNDPVFWLHHCNIDRLWVKWQQQHPNEVYLPQSGGPQGQNVNDLMPPWSNVRVSAVLDHRRLGYVYDTENPTAQGDHMHPGDTLRSGDSISAGAAGTGSSTRPTGTWSCIRTANVPRGGRPGHSAGRPECASCR